MSHENFIRLVNDFCDVTGLDKPMRVVHGGPISINRVIFSLIQKDNDLQRFFIYSDFGAFPKNSTTIAYQALLAQNLFLYPDNGPVFAVSPETGRALCISHYLVSEMNAQKLSQTFTELSTQALKWRETYFLEEELLPMERHLAKLKRR